MYLKSVKARGFKSFGRPVELAFEPGVTVVVGPNGSGKSNIADAVMWAMGEQSPTAIRGANMRDFIFSGSDKLSPAGVAEVEITLDNGSGAMPIEFSEVSISRRLYREGEGTYFINRSPCRLTDVVELLSDAGLGRNSHSIISQGKVDSILESRPQERRACIEEAAGLGKYKKRRHRAEVKLRAVERNLERLADVEEEVRANLRPLKRQATAAERSRKLDVKIATTRAALAGGRLKLVEGQLQGAEALSREAMARRAEVEEKLSTVSRERQATEEELSASLQGHKELAARFYSTRSQLEGLALRRESVRQKQGMLSESRRRLEARVENLKGQAGRIAEETRQAEGQRRRDQVSLKEAEEELAARNAELRRLDDEINSRQKAGEEKARRVVELGAARERYRHQIEFLTARKERLNGAVMDAAAELKDKRRDLEEVEAAAAAGEKAAALLQDESARLQSLLADLKSERQRLENERNVAVRERRRLAEDLQIAKARLTFIGDSHRERSGLPPATRKISDEHAVKALMELIEIEPGYERAVAAVLGNRVFALAVRDFEHGSELLKAAFEGELGSVEFIFPADNRLLNGDYAPNDRIEGEDFLLDHIDTAEDGGGRLAALLAGVRVVDDIAEASGEDSGIWVTRDGVVFDAARSLLSFRGDRPSSMVLKQRNERARLEKELLAIEAGQEEAERRVGALEEELRQAVLKEEAAAEEHTGALSGHREQDEALMVLQSRKRSLEHEAEFKETVLQEHRDEVSGIEAELKAAGQGLSEAERALAETGFAGGDERTGGEELAARRDEVAGKVTRLEVAAAQVRERERLAGLTLAHATEEKERIEGEVKSLQTSLEAESRREPVCQKLLALMDRLQQVYQLAAAELKEQMVEAEELSATRSSALRELSRTEAELQQKLSLASDASTEREVEVAKLRDQLSEQQTRLENLKNRYPDSGLEEVEPAGADEIEQVEEQIERLLRNRELIGPVNPLAQQEYEEMLKRKEFLARQREDLENSLKELAGLIGELTARIEESFNNTFEAVRDNFTEVIASLFPGGEGRLTLVEPEAGEPQAGTETEAGPGSDGGEGTEGDEAEGDESTPVSSAESRGIEISVKPPRKAVRNLSLFSGGERSLVAIAFLFAIFLARPAPFYILDEVEAALDDINISRLLGMLRSFQDRTQFIVITHQKRTMEVADILYGVSMGPDGTSRVLSRKMPEADGQPPEVGPAAGLDERRPAAVAG